MPPRILFISDLHLEESRQDITNSFLNFLKGNQNRCSALYILGDLFEVWIGDDAISELEIIIADALTQFSNCGASIYLLHGNRDFLIMEDYAKLCSANLIDDHHIIHSGSDKILLLHGDTLCTDDVDYQQFRILVRGEVWKKDFMSKSIVERTVYANEARTKSQTATATKPEKIMDVNHNAVHELFKGNDLTKIIHGHTHRPAIHNFKVALNDNSPKKVQRIVLGDWDKLGWYAELTDGKFLLNSFSLSD